MCEIQLDALKTMRIDVLYAYYAKNELCMFNDYGSKIDLITSKFLVIIIILIEDYIFGYNFKRLSLFIFLEKKIFY